MSFGIHAPARAAILLGAATVILAWAAIADGPVSAVRLVGLRTHRVGLIVIGITVLALPAVTRTLGDLEVLLPCVGAGVVLIRCGLVRWTPAPEVRASNGPDPTAELARAAGRTAGRAGRIVTQHADVVVPRGARIAGRLVGRLRSRHPR